MFYDADDYKHKCFRLVVFVAKVFLFIFTERKSFYKCHEKKLKTMKKKKKQKLISLIPFLIKTHRQKTRTLYFSLFHSFNGKNVFLLMLFIALKEPTKK